VAARQVGTSLGGSIIAPTNPWTPFSWYSAQNVNRSGNTGIGDGTNLASWNNLGTIGAAADNARQAGNCLFHKVAAIGRMGNLSGVEFDGTGWMTTPLFAARAATWILGMVVMLPFPTVGSWGWCDGSSTSRGGLFTSAGTEHISMASSGIADSGLAITTNTFETVVAVFNGASSFVRLNATQSANINPAIGGGLTGVTLGSLITGIDIAHIFILEYMASDQAVDIANPTGFEAWAAASYGATPQ
jgi:hypothetical protein